MRYMLDTNAVGRAVKGHPSVVARLSALPKEGICVSVVTEAELLFGLAKAPEATRLATLVRTFLASIDRLPWDSLAAEHYGRVRADLVQRGRSLGGHDMLIAAHALAVGAVLVTSDKALLRVPGLSVEDWMGA